LSSKLEQLLRDLHTALFESVPDSEAAGAVLHEIREAGLSAYLVLDDPDTDQEPEVLRLIPETKTEGELSPAFRIDHTDLTILRGLGIDPTRTLRGGRRARRK
jgi:hypothetical protein